MSEADRPSNGVNIPEHWRNALRGDVGEAIALQVVGEMWAVLERLRPVAYEAMTALGEAVAMRRVPGDQQAIVDRLYLALNGETQQQTTARQERADVETSDDRAMTETLEERDRYHDYADELANRIAIMTRTDIGEHSSGNDPWENALEASEGFIAETVVLCPHGMPLAENVCGPCSKGKPNRPSVETPAETQERPFKKIYTELLALSDAMGNPALEWDGDDCMEQALIREATRRLSDMRDAEEDAGRETIAPGDYRYYEPKRTAVKTGESQS